MISRILPIAGDELFPEALVAILYFCGKMNTRISVVVPVYMEEDNIRPFLMRLEPVLEKLGGENIFRDSFFFFLEISEFCSILFRKIEKGIFS